MDTGLPSRRTGSSGHGANAAGEDAQITSSASARTDAGIVSPSAFAVLPLMTNSNLVGCITGISAGLARMLRQRRYGRLWPI